MDQDTRGVMLRAKPEASQMSGILRFALNDTSISEIISKCSRNHGYRNPPHF